MVNKTLLLIALFILSTVSASSQSLEWAKRIGGSASETGKIVVLDQQFNLYVAGMFADTVDFDPGPDTANLVSFNNGNDLFFAKYDSSGNYIWANKIGGYGAAICNDIALDSLGFVYITGGFYSADFDPDSGVTSLGSAGIMDGFIAKYDSSGGLVWAKNIGGSYPSSEVEGIKISIGVDGDIFVAGQFHFTVDFDPGPGTENLVYKGLGDIFIAKYDAFGNYKWVFGIGDDLTEYLCGLVLDSNDNVYVTGSFVNAPDFDPDSLDTTILTTSFGSSDIYIAKYDSSGNFLWANSIGGTGSNAASVGRDLVLDDECNIYITGRFGKDTIDFDPGPDTANLISSLGREIYFAKYDTDGNYLWAKNIGHGVGTGIELDTSRNVYVTGCFWYTADFDPGPGVDTLTSFGLTDIFIAKYDNDGNFVWVNGMGSAGGDLSNDVTIDDFGNVYIIGSFNDTVDFDPGSDTANLFNPSVYLRDLFLAKYNQCAISSFIVGATTICLGDSLTFINTSSGAMSYQWIENGIDISNDTNLIHEFNSVGLYSISLMTVDSMCGNTHDVSVSVNPIDTLSVSIIGTDTVCSGDSAIFIAFGTNGGSTPIYNWTINGTSVGTNDSLYSSAAVSDDDTISCTLTSNKICIWNPIANSNELIMTVNPAPLVDFIGLGVSHCLGDSSITLEGIPTGGIFSGPGMISDQFYADSAGIGFHSIVYRVWDSIGCSNADTDFVSINPLPVISIASTSSLLDSCFASATVSVIAGTSPFTYQWNDPYNQMNPTADSLCGGSYVVLVTDINGCVAIGSVAIYDTLVSIFETSFFTSVKIYPNPTSGVFNIEAIGDLSEEFEVVLYNSLGQEINHNIFKFENGHLTSKVDLGKYPGGVYTLRVLSDSGVITRQVIVE